MEYTDVGDEKALAGVFCGKRGAFRRLRKV